MRVPAFVLVALANSLIPAPFVATASVGAILATSAQTTSTDPLAEAPDLPCRLVSASLLASVTACPSPSGVARNLF